MVWELASATIVAVAVAGWDGGMRMARLALVVGLALFVVACSARQTAPGPMIDISVRNHTNAAIDYVVTTREPQSNGRPTLSTRPLRGAGPPCCDPRPLTDR